MKILDAQQQEQLIKDLQIVMKQHGVTSFYSVVEINDPSKERADFCGVLGGGSPSTVISALAKQTFSIVRQISSVDLTQIKDN